MTDDTSFRLCQYFGMSATYWNLQNAYEPVKGTSPPLRVMLPGPSCYDLAEEIVLPISFKIPRQ